MWWNPTVDWRPDAETAAKIAMHEALEDAGLFTGPGDVRMLVRVVLDAVEPIVTGRYRGVVEGAGDSFDAAARRKARDAVATMQKDRDLSREERDAAKKILPLLLHNPRYNS
jgi:hypothetical protein